MATLNHIVTQLADALNRPTDGPFKKRLKELVIQEFAMFVSRSITKYGIDDEFVLSYLITELRLVTTINGKTLARPYYQTVNKIPRPLRYSSNCPFIYVGEEDGDVPYSYRKISSRKFTNILPNVGAGPSYDFSEDRLQLWNLPNVIITPADPLANPPTDAVIAPKTLLVLQVPSDPRLSQTPDVFKDFVFDDDREFPITQDMVQQIKLSLLQGELTVTDSKDKVEATHLDNN
jgi:hypothetical protein